MHSRSTATFPRVQPIIPVLRSGPFNHPAWLFEPKYDGFRGVVYLTGARCAIYSKRGNRFSRFSDLEKLLCGAFPRRSMILDGEVVAFDSDGRISFWHSMRGEGRLGFVAFDLLWSRGRDVRALPLSERKERLAGIIPAQTGIVCSTLTIDEHGQELLRLFADSTWKASWANEKPTHTMTGLAGSRLRTPATVRQRAGGSCLTDGVGGKL